MRWPLSTVVALILLVACSSTPHPTVVNVIAVAAGTNHALALKSDGSVWAWGSDENGQLGLPAGSGLSKVPIPVKDLQTGAVAIAAGSDLSMALKADGSVWAWGLNQRGQLGNGGTADNPVPGRVTGLSGRFIAIAAGSEFALALRSDGTVWAWGDGVQGQLGNGILADSPTPVQVVGLKGKVTAIAAGDNHALAIEADGSLWGWGDNGQDQLGVPTPDASQATPVRIQGIAGQVIAVAGGPFQTMAISSDGGVFAWGQSYPVPGASQIGTSVPTAVALAPRARQVQAGFGVDLALLSDGSVWAWGHGSSLLGAAAQGDVLDPIPVTGLERGVVRISASDSTGYAITSKGHILAWGANNQGQLGNGTIDLNGPGSSTPAEVTGF